MPLKPSSCSLRGTNLPRIVSTLTSTCLDCLPVFALCINGMPQDTSFVIMELPINHLGLPVFVRKPILCHLLFNIVRFTHIVCTWYRFIVYGLYYVEVGSFYTYFLGSIFGHKWVLNFVKSFSASVEIIIWFLSFNLFICMWCRLFILILVWICLSVFIWSTIDGHLGDFPVLGSYEYINTLYISYGEHKDGFLSRSILGVELLGHRVHVYSALFNAEVDVLFTLLSAVSKRSGLPTCLIFWDISSFSF